MTPYRSPYWILLVLLLPPMSVLAQSNDPVDFTGTWAARNHEDIGDAALPGDYSGMPINDEARARADAWSASTQSMPERQCIMYTGFYTVLGPQALRVSSQIDPISGKVIAYHMTGAIDRLPRTLWMDGRPHPSKYDRHTAAGFSTGVWQGKTLFVQTTHLTASLIGRTGVPSSDEATIDEYISRDADTLQITMFLYDPVYFEGPYVRNRMWVLDPEAHPLPEPCEPAVETSITSGLVPNYLPGANPFLRETSNKFGIPLSAIRGGANTTYPEYRKQLQHAINASGK